jgi:RNA 3'-phosphate cyclase
MIQLDGSHGEGGGALVRTALAFATLTGKEVKINNIRAGRPKPGLKAQHLTVIRALQEMSGAKCTDIHLGAEEIMFIPGKIKRGNYSFDIGTAGSISLFLQGVILPSMFAPGKVTITVKGGTCGKWQASVEYIKNILFPQLQRFVDKIDLKVLKRGYYPKGGGEVSVEIMPRFNQEESYEALLEDLHLKVSKIKLIERNEIIQIKGAVNVSKELGEDEVAERIERSIKGSLTDLEVPVNIRNEYVQTDSLGGDVVLWAMCESEDIDNPIILGASSLLERGKRSEEIGKEVVSTLRKELDSKKPVDHYLADQLIPFMGLLPGSVIEASEISNHSITNIYVVEKFMNVGFTIKDNRIEVRE